MAAQTHPQSQSMTGVRAPARREGEGWLTYAGVLLLIGSVLNIIWGIAAIGNAHFFINDANFVFSGLNTWGWVTLLIGVGLLFAGIGLFSRSTWAVWVGIAFLSINAIDQLLALPAYPFWSLAMFAVCMLGLYGLIAHGTGD